MASVKTAPFARNAPPPPPSVSLAPSSVPACPQQMPSSPRTGSNIDLEHFVPVILPDICNVSDPASATRVSNQDRDGSVFLLEAGMLEDTVYQCPCLFPVREICRHNTKYLLWVGFSELRFEGLCFLLRTGL